MTRPSVRLSDVARAAGTSTKTASRVINGDHRVSEETRRRVQLQVEQLGYRVDIMARTLRRGVDDAVGVVVPTIGDPFFATMLEEIEQLAIDRSISILVASNSRNPKSERAVIEGLLARRVAGMLIAPFSTDYSFLSALSTPAVFLDRHPCGLEAGAVLVDDFGEAKRAIRHLASYRHRRIALVVDDLSIETSRQRRAGYLAALAELGMPAEESLELIGCVNADDAEARITAVLSSDRPPTAVFSARSETSLGVVRALHRNARTDVAFFSFGDFATADILSPAISVLDHDPRILARIAMEQLMGLLDGTSARPMDVLVPLTLLPRGSGEISPPLLCEGVA